MRLSLVLAASVVSASILRPRLAPNLPADAFPKFHPLSFEDAQAGKDLIGHEHNGTHARGFDSSVPTVQTRDQASCSANPNMRFEWRQYSTSDRLAFVAAIKCLMNSPPSGNFPPATSRYEDFVRLHQLYMPNIHGNPKFLVWHRYFLWTFEQVMRDECGFNRAWPWWDETLDAGQFAQSDMFTSPDYFGHLPGPINGDPVCIISGAFAGLTCNIGPGSSNIPHCLSRSVDESLTGECNSGFVNMCNSRGTYADMESCSEGGPHAYGHNGIGAVMSDVSASPSDPIFWMHHSFVDHSFRIWQNMDPSRTQTINGNDAQGNPLTLDTIVYMGGIRPDVTIGQIMNTLGGANIGGVPFCYRYNY